MPANINECDGHAAVMVVGEPAWHRLGTVLDHPATAAEALAAAHLDWRVIKQPLFAGNDARRAVSNYFAIVREDEWKQNKTTVLGIVGKDYTPLQNREAFDFFDPIVGEGAAIYHTAGALGEGERVWILASCRRRFASSVMTSRTNTCFSVIAMMETVQSRSSSRQSAWFARTLSRRRCAKGRSYE